MINVECGFSAPTTNYKECPSSANRLTNDEVQYNAWNIIQLLFADRKASVTHQIQWLILLYSNSAWIRDLATENKMWISGGSLQIQ